MDSVTGEDQSPFDSLVGEGKKFKDKDALAKSVFHKDDFIETLKREKEELESRMTTLQVEIEKQKKTTGSVTPNTTQSGTSKEVVTEESIQALIEKVVSERETTATRTRNLQSAKKHLMDNFGERAEEHLQTQASSMGITKEKLLEIASDTPSIFMRLFPVDKPKTQNSTSGNVNTESLELNHTSDVSEYRALSDARKKMGVGNFFSDTSNWKKLIEAKKRELAAG